MINRISLISNICFEPYCRTCFEQYKSGSFNGIRLHFISYNNYQDDIEETVSSDIILVCLNFEEMYPDLFNDFSAGRITYNAVEKDCIRVCSELYSNIKNHSNAPVYWFGFEDYYCASRLNFGSSPMFDGLVDRVNNYLYNLVNDDLFVDLKRLIASIGIKNAYDAKGKYRWNAPYSKELINLMADEVYKQYLVEKGITKKCLVLDCDNVLWGGVLSEDGIENIKLAGSGFGRLYQDFQRFVLSLYNHGVILAICSKNDLTDVLNVFREHSEMILKEEHIACFQVNWDDKPGNLKTIAEKLNIGLDSIVFVDDSPVEIEAVKTLLPDVTTILFHRDMDYSQFSCFNLKRNVSLADIEKRNKTYRTNARRDELKEQSGSYEEYVKALDIKTEIHRIVPMEYSRVSELTQRTNKCTSGRRFTVQEIEDLIESSGMDFYSVHVTDRFSDLGLVGAFAVKDNELVLLCLSCRALGRGIENTMLEYILSNWNIESVAYHSTGKNACLKELIEEKILIKQPFM